MKIAKTIGIVGGMGPEAGLSLFRNILYKTNAREDQEHLSTILMSFPGVIADRTRYLYGKTTVNPAYSIVEIIKKLETAGAGIIGMACNTAYSPSILEVITTELKACQSSVLLMNMPYETCLRVKIEYPEARRIGVLATNGTYHSGVYHDTLSNFGFEVIVPDPELQLNTIHNLIYHPRYGIKANPGRVSSCVKENLKKAMSYFKGRQTEVLILGCTDLSILLKEGVTNEMTIVDSSASFAHALIREASRSDKNYNL